MKNNTLAYFPGTYNNFLLHQEEMLQLQKNRVEKERVQERLVQGIIENVRVHGQSSQVSSKKKKLERVSMHSRLDGKKFKLFSLSKISEDALRFPDRIQAIMQNRTVRFKFAEPDLARLRLATPESPLFVLENADIGWLAPPSPSSSSTTTVTPNFNVILSNVTMHLNPKSKVAIIGNNGQGKSTFIEAVMEAINGNYLAPPSAVPNISTRGGISVFRPATKPATSTNTDTAKKANTSSIASTFTISSNGGHSDAANAVIRGKVTVHNNLTVGVVSQNHIAALSDFLLETAVSYMIFQSRKRTGLAWSEETARAHLGSFGLGDIALQQIGSFSGGQKARLAFACASIGSPQLLLLDEPTNHLSLESVEGLAVACRDYQVSLSSSSSTTP